MTDPASSQPQILILYVHPYPHQSRINAAMRQAAATLPHVTVHDLYDAYPDFHVDRRREQSLLAGCDVVVFQHPFYWYSAPALLKEWMDTVLEYGWAYGAGGVALQGRDLVQAISTGGPAEAYQPMGYNQYSMMELLRPFERSAALCGMNYRPPFLLQGARLKTPEEVAAHAAAYRNWLNAYPHPRDCPGCEQPSVPQTDR